MTGFLGAGGGEWRASGLDPEGLDLRINRRPGILENGLFIHLADHVLTASPSGVDVDSLGDVSL